MRLDVHSATIAVFIMAGIFLLAWPLAQPIARLDSVPVVRPVARFVASAAFEIGLVCGLFALWQVANRLSRGHTTGGLKRGRQLWHLERVLHFPSEVDVQKLILPYPHVVRFVNYYYDTAHLTFMFIFLIWLWLQHRDRYPFFRNMMVAFTGMALLVQMIAVAPPRLIGGTGLVDTAALYHQSVYAVFSNIADQYAAMPSIHVGWAVLISFAVVSASPSRWRWLAILHGAFTIFVVVATANHYWSDCIVAIALLGVAWVIANGVERVRVWLPRRIEPAQIQQGAFSS